MSRVIWCFMEGNKTVSFPSAVWLTVDFRTADLHSVWKMMSDRDCASVLRSLTASCRTVSLAQLLFDSEPEANDTKSVFFFSLLKQMCTSPTVSDCRIRGPTSVDTIKH